MGFGNRSLIQEITYWAPQAGGASNDFGHATLAAPVKIYGRWENREQLIRKPNGDEAVSVAEVWVDTDVDINGYLVLGDYTGESSPVAAAREIQDYRTNPDLRNLETERRAFL